MRTPDELRDAVDDLKRILRLESVEPADALWLEVAEISIGLDAIESAANSKRSGGPMRITTELSCAAIRLQISDLVMNILAYYGLPLEIEGVNEPMIGPPEARRLRSRYLQTLAHNEPELMRLRDELAEYMLGLGAQHEEE